MDGNFKIWIFEYSTTSLVCSYSLEVDILYPKTTRGGGEQRDSARTVPRPLGGICDHAFRRTFGWVTGRLIVAEINSSRVSSYWLPSFETPVDCSTLVFIPAHPFLDRISKHGCVSGLALLGLERGLISINVRLSFWLSSQLHKAADIEWTFGLIVCCFCIYAVAKKLLSGFVFLFAFYTQPFVWIQV